MMNNVSLVGRLTKDPELKYTQTGIAVARFTLAVQRSFANAEGKREADFVQVVVWRKQAENASNFIRKGSLVGVSGSIQTGSFEGQDGKRVYTTEVHGDVSYLEPKPSGDAQGNQQSQQGNQQQQQNNQQQQQNNQQQQQQQQQQQSQQNYTRTDNDPFSTGGGPIEVSDDDLPF